MTKNPAPLPAEAELIVVGGGTAGAVVAARLAERGVDVLLLEAGPDPGPLGDPRWPADLVDATRLGHSCDWGFDSGDSYPDQTIRFERSRILGGCSTHNGAVQTWGHRRDYDDWAAAGNPGWATDDLLPLFRRASEQLRVTTYAIDELTPWQEAWRAAGPAVGLPQLADLNDLDETVGFAPESVNVVEGGVRFNNAFAYLDPVRGRPNLRIVGDALVDRLLVEDGRAVGVVVRHGGAPVEVRAARTVLAGGTFCSPAVLLRSGVGPAADLRALGIPVVADRPGVGANLHDQPFVLLTWEGSDEIARAMDAAAARGWAPDEQVMAKAASSFDPGLFDLHLLPYSPTHIGDGRTWHAGAGCLLPRSRGRVALVDRDPETLPTVDHGFLTDEQGHDVRVLAEGVALLRELAAQPQLARLLGRERTPGPATASLAEIEAHLRHNIDSYWHPVGSCRMGPAGDPTAVVDARAEVHGLPGCFVADCSLMPTIPRATTAMPATVIGERVAELLLEPAA
ncbi:Choline dehydrogenase [Patulibacter medicamentivorans]|uniref:Choline dehydrogenase n=1 Tax=Patulibacter medicamentivorans TaxID=1097667 RepID=H0E321_9ACTN|nr:GMC family oxidoreductase [Patulibacter medicamentivorans]EHN11930.1 Choline dehydrogenase [Patulibacter medicamentivorans]